MKHFLKHYYYCVAALHLLDTGQIEALKEWCGYINTLQDRPRWINNIKEASDYLKNFGIEVPEIK